MKKFTLLIILLVLMGCVEEIPLVNEEANPRIISNILIKNITDKSAEVTWEQSVEGSGYIEFGSSPTYGIVSLKEVSYSKSHGITLDNLTEDSIYHFRIVSIDRSLNKLISDDQTFKTAKKEISPTPTPEIEKLAKAPILLSAVLDGLSYKLKFELPSDSLAPDGSYDTYINGIDQNDRASHSGFERTITGLDIYSKQCFIIQARYIQKDPDVLLSSNEKCVEAQMKPAPEAKAPVLISAVLDGLSYKLKFELPSDSLDPEGSYDTYVNGVDQNDRASHSGFERTITDLDIYSKQCFIIQARYIQKDPDVLLSSNEKCVEAQERPETPAVDLAEVKHFQKLFDAEWIDDDQYPDQVQAVRQSKSANKKQEYYFLSYYY